MPEDRVFILLFFSTGGIASAASSSDSVPLSKLLVSSVDSSSSSYSGVCSFFFYFCEEGLEFSLFFSLDPGVSAGSGSLAVMTGASPNPSAIVSLLGHCERGVLISSRGFSFLGVSFGGGIGGRLDSPADDPETIFWISTKAVSIFHVKVTKTLIILAADTSPSVLMSSSKKRALLKTIPRVPTTSLIYSKHLAFTFSSLISSFHKANSTLRSATSFSKDFVSFS